MGINIDMIKAYDKVKWEVFSLNSPSDDEFFYKIDKKVS